jgi:ribulose-5-phosphate 4-epimerase/fuculose-1-phosphate aldolase
VRDEGVIKYECSWTAQALPPLAGLTELIDFRNRVYRDGLIGVYPDGIGFGNISIRVGDGVGGDGGRQFAISASQTGQIAEANADHFALVTAYDFAANTVTCIGPLPASSESLTHAMIYERFTQSAAVIHVHSETHWRDLQGRIPTSGADVAYGTPEMAGEVQRLANEENLEARKIFVMAGHEDGILSFGNSLEEAYSSLRAWVF